jgi:hypothetical protein
MFLTEMDKEVNRLLHSDFDKGTTSSKHDSKPLLMMLKKGSIGERSVLVRSRCLKTFHRGYAGLTTSALFRTTVRTFESTKEAQTVICENVARNAIAVFPNSKHLKDWNSLAGMVP